MYLSLICAVICILGARESGRSFDQQYRDIGGKPEFVEIPKNWRWLFYKPKEFYKRSNKLTKVSLVFYSIWYMGFCVQMILFFASIITGKVNRFNAISWYILCAQVILSMIITIALTYRYDSNMRKSYDYDFMSYYIEQIRGVCKRKCRVVDVIDEHICEIEIGYFKKRRFKATTEIKVKVGEERYVMHYNHPIDVNEPYWEVRRH